MGLLAGFLEKLAATPDGDGTLLDQSMIVYGGGISDGDQHSHVDLPLILAGGGAGTLKGGRHLSFTDKETPMANLLVSVLDKAGVQVDELGDSTGRLPMETLSDV